MKGGGFYKGTSTEQTPYFEDKEKKLIEKIAWPEIYNYKIDVGKINFNVVETWVNKRLIEILGFEDEILSEYCISQLKHAKEKKGTITTILRLATSQLQLLNAPHTGNKKSEVFVKELLELLISNEKDEERIAKSLVESKKSEIEKVISQDEALRKNIENIKSIYTENHPHETDHGNTDKRRGRDKRVDRKEVESRHATSEESNSNYSDKKKKKKKKMGALSQHGETRTHRTRHGRSDRHASDEESSSLSVSPGRRTPQYRKKKKRDTVSDSERRDNRHHRRYELERERRRKRERERDREREREREREKEREREREREMEKERERKRRDKERDRDRYRMRDWDRDRDRYRSRERGRRRRTREYSETSSDVKSRSSPHSSSENSYTIKKKEERERGRGKGREKEKERVRERKREHSSSGDDSITSSEVVSHRSYNASTSSEAVKSKRKKVIQHVNDKNDRSSIRDSENDSSLKPSEENKRKEINSIMRKKSYKNYKKKLRAWSSSDSAGGKES
ncbi:pre-mRNA splicing factor, putative [Plasmodium ovale wallikeri]|uniref:Pre-mRNA splicing factor, putative n=1 Tax=Plasmodium ovale wallikeri TaxID=864142 RepID=A0A1A8YSM2_PLAOA|nr:pre-mRNA splicing factor, putative [Plasmodium ovale wallikeri]